MRGEGVGTVGVSRNLTVIGGQPPFFGTESQSGALDTALALCINFDTLVAQKMPEISKPIALAFWRSATGRGPVREWLKELSREDKRTVGHDIAKVQLGWPVGLPLCRPLSGGLWEVRSSLATKREARVFFGFHEGTLIAMHAIIKKTRRAPAEDLMLARQRLKETQSWQKKPAHRLQLRKLAG
jgi:phage-related protein